MPGGPHLHSHLSAREVQRGGAFPGEEGGCTMVGPGHMCIYIGARQDKAAHPPLRLTHSLPPPSPAFSASVLGLSRGSRRSPLGPAACCCWRRRLGEGAKRESLDSKYMQAAGGAGGTGRAPRCARFSLAAALILLLPTPHSVVALPGGL